MYVSVNADARLLTFLKILPCGENINIVFKFIAFPWFRLILWHLIKTASTASCKQGASWTGRLTAAGIFKPCLLAQWAVAWYLKCPGRMEKKNFQNELTNQRLDSNSKLNLNYRQHNNVKPITLFHFQYVLRNAKQFWSLKRSHHYGISWVVTMAPAVPSTDIVRWLLSYFGHRQDDCNRGVFAISDHTKLIPWLSNINEGWRWHRYHTLARFGRTFVWRDLFTDLTAGEAMVRTSSPRELTAGSRIQHCTHSKKIYVPNLPVELAHFEQ